MAVRSRTRSSVPAGCTGCGELSVWCHSRYVRRLADVPLGGRPLRIDLSVRRLYCENPACPKVTFTEQVPGLTVRYQRRTPLMQRLVEDVGVVLAGRGGARMLRILNVTLSRSTVLTQLMRVPLPPLETPRVLGVDDFAFYGGTYGTLLVDATTRLPLTLWEGRDAEQLSRWLRAHPGVEVACRDGSLAYRQGITAGAPDAVASTSGKASPAESRRSHTSVARELGLDRRTVRKYARARTWQEVMRRPPRTPSTLDPYLDYLQQRWDEGQHGPSLRPDATT
ncbi:transposase family protein [Streptomyces sp. ISL-21]|uniref:transposase family protein n=1 Tax=Streptomyces sp. ISL-21 TaxID=2819179 RepID=UPI0027E57DF4|nr:transposase family protein [Streptomyces sp. ISL-21]